MAITYQLIDFKDLQDSVMEEMKYQSTDSINRARIKRDLNMIYMNEVVSFKKWKWLIGYTELEHAAFYSTGLASATITLTTVTLDTSPDVSLGSFAGLWFSSDTADEIYRISAHTAGDTSITLESAFLGETSSSIKFKIWSDVIALPDDCEETINIYHDIDDRPMEGRGQMELQQLISRFGPKSEGRPLWYYAGYADDFISSSLPTSSDRNRELKVYPAVFDKDSLLHLEYKKRVSPMTDDADEPVMDVEDRAVLLYGALEKAWLRENNENKASYNRAKFQNKLFRMAGKIEDSIDRPGISPDNIYLSSKRYRFRGNSRGNFGRRRGF